jgi:putative salt-induced outer membrane protein YdiY
MAAAWLAAGASARDLDGIDAPWQWEDLVETAPLGQWSDPELDVTTLPDDAALAVFQEEAATEEAAEEEPGKWKSRFDLGFGGSFGNTDTQTLHIGIGSQRVTEHDRTFLDAHYWLGFTDGDRDENKATAGIRHDWLLPDSPWFFFATGRVDYDEFQSWEYRVGPHVGVGYEFINNDEFLLAGRAGIGFNKEFNSEDEPFTWEALLGGDFVWRISDRQTFEIHTDIYPELEDPNSFRSITTAGWALSLAEDSNMSLIAGVRHEYQSEVDPDTDHNDWRINFGLGFDF